MFQGLSDKFQNLFSRFTGNTKLTQENIEEAVRAVRMALLDADVNYTVTSQFVKKVKETALGEVAEGRLAAGDKFIKIVHDELVALMGSHEAELQIKGDFSVIMLVGLQGVGKTTQSVKLAHFLKGKKYQRNPIIIACDLQRPAAIEQLKVLGEKINVPVFTNEGEKDPLKVAKEGLQFARKKEHDLVIVDTAGRLHVDEELMGQLRAMKGILEPQETLFVASASTGQDAVKTAKEFDEQIGITGSILTMLDGSSRAGAAISILEVTKKPLKFEGIGEKIEDLQLFHPESMADRILGMGDVINLVKKVESEFDKKDQASIEKKFMTASFTYQDYLDQMGKLRKMGPLKNLLKMMPGMPSLPEGMDPDKDFKKMESIISSMTKMEREGEVELDHSRKLRIAKGSGHPIEEINKLVKGFKQIKQMAKNLPQLKKKFKGMGDLGKFF